MHFSSTNWPSSRRDDLFARLLDAGQPGLVRVLESIASQRADSLLVHKKARLCNDQVTEAEVIAFVEAHGATVVHVPSTTKQRKETRKRRPGGRRAFM